MGVKLSNEHIKDMIDTGEDSLKEALAHDDGGWTKETPTRWARKISNGTVVYFPKQKRYRYRGKVKRFSYIRDFYDFLERNKKGEC